MVKIDAGNSEEKLDNDVQSSIGNLSETLKNSHSNIFSPELIASFSSLQNMINHSNIAAIFASSTSNLAHQLVEASKVSLPQISIDTSFPVNPGYFKALSETIASYNNILSSPQIDAVRNIANSVNKIIDGLQFDYSKLATNLGEILKNIPSPYSEDEINEIIANVKRLAEQGWVIYYDFGDIYRRISVGNIEELEDEWLTQLKIDLSSEDIYIELKESLCYSEPLIDSMIESYKGRNYYAAYTLATLAIDGALNRISEQATDKEKIPVGYSAVKILDKQFADKTFSDIGLIHWLFIFFKGTNQFTLDEPNRHMIGHGRWEGTISERDFLKLFNVMLYILASFELWQYSLVEEQ